MSEDKKDSIEYEGLTIEDLVQEPTVYRDDLFAGQTIVISGAGTGMGRAMAILTARLGANVVICGRRQDKLDEVKQAIAEATGKEITAQSVNIRDPESVEAFLESVFETFGRLDTLINSAGGQFSQAAIDFSRKGWLAVIDTNLNGTWWMMQEAAKRWRDRNQPGNIINIAAHVERGMPQSAHSCAARR